MTAPWLVVARHEILARLGDRTFRAMTLLMMVLLAASLGFSAWTANRANDYTIVTSQQGKPLAEAIARTVTQVNERDTAEVTVVATDDAARAEVLGDTADAWLHPADQGWALDGKDSVDIALTQAAQLATQSYVLSANAAAAGVDLPALTRGTTLTTGTLAGDAEQQNIGRALGFLLAILFYISSISFGAVIAASVVEEKASRLVEIIATRIPIRQLLAGKIAGSAALAVAQMALYAAVGIIGVRFSPWADKVPTLSPTLAWFLLFFLVGFVLLAALWAVAGALSSRNEDIQATSMPLTLLLVGMYFGAMFLTGRWLTIGSFVPPLSAILMPIRIATGEANWVQALAALALLAVATVLIVLAAERLYRRALLQTRGRVSVHQAWAGPE